MTLAQASDLQPEESGLNRAEWGKLLQGAGM